MAAAYLRARRLRDRSLAVLNGVFDGVWLGLLDRPALAELDSAYYDARRAAPARDRDYADERYNLRGLTGWEEEAVLAHFPLGASVTVTAAGAGREVIALCRLGYDAVGYEPNPVLVEAGRALMKREGLGDRLTGCERDVFPAQAAPTGAVVVGWGSYGLVPGAARRVSLLRAARVRLPEGAPLLVSFFLRPRRDRYFSIVLRSANVLRRLRGAEPAELGDTLAWNYVHHFTRQEVEAELSSAGFELELFTGEPYAHALGRAA